jgi:hypothetical protein
MEMVMLKNVTIFFCNFVKTEIMIGETLIEKQLRLAVLLDDAKTWFDVHNDQIKGLILRLIKDEQLNKQGVDKFEQIIGLYSEMTQMINPEKIAGTPFTLKDSGQFYNSMFVEVLTNELVIHANADKMENQKWWNTNILGLTENNLEIYVVELRKKYISWTRFVLGIN